MQQFIDAVRQAIRDRNWYAALFLSLTLPDICGAMEDPNRRNGERYRAWFDNNLSDIYEDNLSSELCWLLRNACLHEGNDRAARMAFGRVHFTVPPGRGIIIHNVIMNNVLQLQIDQFCLEICDAVENWLNLIPLDTEIRSRIDEMMRIHPISSFRRFINLGED